MKTWTDYPHPLAAVLAILFTLTAFAGCRDAPAGSETPTSPDDGGAGQVYLEVDNTCGEGPAYRYIRFANEDAEAWYLRPTLLPVHGKPRMCVGADVDPHSCRRVLIPVDPGENAVTTLTAVGERTEP
ncbi:MAG: hypothetical protein OXQ93_16450 [Gemmatimonadota bacterium]|nr:hypothetical protein [Gemmatimonadota bacterium]